MANEREDMVEKYCERFLDKSSKIFNLGDAIICEESCDYGNQKIAGKWYQDNAATICTTKGRKGLLLLPAPLERIEMLEKYFNPN